MADINLGVGGANSATGGYEIDNSVKTEATNNEWFYRSSPTQGNRQTFTFSFWHKRSQITNYPADPYLMSQGSNARFHITGNTNPTLRFMFDGNSTELESSPRIRDTAAWYHIVLAVDTTQATASNRVKLYLNGEQISWDNSAYPSQNATSTWMSTTNMYFNTRDGDGSYDASGYYAEICVIDGQQLAPTSFGEFDSDSGIWKPIDVSGLTFGNEGFYLDFEDSSDLGADVSGNNNDCTLNNIAAADQATDTPTNNFATMNVLAHNNSRADFTSGGTVIQNNVEAWCTGVSTIAVNKGKWYAEFAPVDPHAIYHFVGVVDVSDLGSVGNTYLGVQGSIAIGIYSLNGSTYDGVNTATYTTAFGWDQNGPNSGEGDIISVALDADNGYIYFRSNGGSWANSGDPTSGSSGTGGEPVPLGGSGYYCIGQSINEGNRAEGCANYGGYTRLTVASGNSDANGYGNFEYAPPSGYYALCSKNLAEYG